MVPEVFQGNGQRATFFKAMSSIGIDTSILFAERKKKRGWKRKKVPGAFIAFFSCSQRVERKAFFTLRQTHFFTRDRYAQDK